MPDPGGWDVPGVAPRIPSALEIAAELLTAERQLDEAARTLRVAEEAHAALASIVSRLRITMGAAMRREQLVRVDVPGFGGVSEVAARTRADSNGVLTIVGCGGIRVSRKHRT